MGNTCELRCTREGRSSRSNLWQWRASRNAEGKRSWQRLSSSLVYTMRTLSCDPGKQLSDPSHFSPSKVAWVLEPSFWKVLINAGLDIQREANCLPCIWFLSSMTMVGRFLLHRHLGPRKSWGMWLNLWIVTRRETICGWFSNTALVEIYCVCWSKIAAFQKKEQPECKSFGGLLGIWKYMRVPYVGQREVIYSTSKQYRLHGTILAQNTPKPSIAIEAIVGMF